jgi:hypothetical protein
MTHISGVASWDRNRPGLAVAERGGCVLTSGERLMSPAPLRGWRALTPG